MNYREFGRTGWKVSEISFGTWAIGGSWGAVRDEESLDALRRAIDLGVNFNDTAVHRLKSIIDPKSSRSWMNWSKRARFVITE